MCYTGSMIRTQRTLSFPVSILCAILAAVCWSLSPVLSRMIREYYSVLFQNLFRFGVSLIILWIFTLARLGARGVRAGLSNVPYLSLKLAGLAVFVFIHQVFYIGAVYRIFPAMAALLSETNVVYTIFFSYFMFHDERATIKTPGFKIGLLLALFGMCVIIVSGSNLRDAEMNIGVVYIIISALGWSLFTVFNRKWIPRVPPSLATSIIFSMDTLFFALYILLFQSGVSYVPHTPLAAWLILALSGVLGIGAGYTLYFSALPGAGITVTASLSLLIPLITATASYILLGELLLPMQAAAGGVLLAGCYLIVRARYRRR